MVLRRVFMILMLCLMTMMMGAVIMFVANC